MTRFDRPALRAGALCASALLALGLSACAPELGDAAGLTDKNEESVNPETSWGDQDQGEEEKIASLPESFPSEEFVLPEGVTIDNAGERGVDRWFVVLLAANPDDAEAIWDAVVQASNFAVVDEGETIEGGRFATLNGVTLSTQAVTIPQEDSSVLVTYDIVRWS